MSHEENVFFKMIYEVSDYAILLLDVNGIVMNWNTGAQRIKGYEAEEIVGNHFEIFYTEHDRLQRKPESLLEIARLMGRATDEGWRLRKDGSTFWGSITITAIHDENGNVNGYTKVTRDLTERRKAELELVEHAKELEKKNRELEQFAYIASHDLQEPLRTITSLYELLNSSYFNNLDENARQMMEFVGEATERMRQLIQGLLEYSRIGKESFPEWVDCQKIVQDVVDDLQLLIRETDTEIMIGPMPHLMGYEVELRQMFANLITNAIKFRKPGDSPLVIITATQEFATWKFAVKDNGIGIPSCYHDKIFIIFQRLHPREMYEGVGIGLAHCHKIAELHKGDIWVDSQEGQGSTFYFTIDTLKLKSA
ncbi:sensor histidine kinase [Flavobacterium stagni]|uniref:histidine kinase n=1 Tax=Flavobacterium stagni TaxID=2506421 RepID=A0A4V1N2G6_9FLAO|nr:ATP-binding protein [Flavobacterium stagni]RXR21670.1 PAS domain S-box protein [Flavobacterium stagni]